MADSFDAGYDDSDDTCTLDTWKPKKVNPKIPTSAWRKKQNDRLNFSPPSLDDLKKITLYIKKKYPDSQILDAFNINSETLVAIKRNCYCPVEGISLDTLSKIAKEFNRVEKKLDRIFEALKFLSNNLFDSKEASKRLLFKTLIASPKNGKPVLCDEDE